jgi:sigma-B regulation protein RsbU (phosphoserine phosphatase)
MIAAMKLRFRTKLFLVQVSLGALLAAVASAVVYYELRLMPMHTVGGGLAATVAQAAAAIDAGDVLALSGAPNPANDERFEKVRRVIADVRDNLISVLPMSATADVRASLVRDFYVVVPTHEPSMGRMVVTARRVDAGRFIDMTGEADMERGFEGLAIGSSIIRDGVHSTYSAYAPIRDASGHAVAIVGMDAEAAMFEPAWRSAAVLVGSGFLVVVLASGLIAWRIAARMNRPLEQLDAAVQRVAGGDLDVQLESPRSGDEFDTLFSHFNQMVHGLRRGEATQRSLELASRIQRELLPDHPPQIAGFDLAGGVAYCDETGGDYYDYFDLVQDELEAVRVHDILPHTRWGLAVGDVTGHGITAALLMAWTRAVLRTEAPEFGEDVSGLMRNINRHLLRDAAAGVFLTLFYAVLDAPARRLIWSSAGHEPGVLYRAAENRLVELHSTDVPLGIEPRAFAAGEPVVLSPGDVLVVTSDGVTQARNPAGKMLMAAGVGDVIARHAHLSAAEMRDHIIAHTRAYIGDTSPEDDITLIVLKAV